ncbi:MAG: anti-sigma factor antagonist [Actinobacteria bacterium]|nr:MAG: anti-sigma factor antagonist [Actinomycetota bacterium]
MHQGRCTLSDTGGVILNTHVREVGGIPVVELEGEIDLSTSPVFKETVYGVIESGKIDVIIDLNALEFMDSTGLGVLVAALKKTSMEGGSIRLICNKRNILKVFTVTGLDKVFSIYDNLQRCLQA